MNPNTKPDRNHVMVESHSQQYVSCPYCWTDQRTDRDFCYRCGAEFVYPACESLTAASALNGNK